jgi:hypothetical protein
MGFLDKLLGRGKKVVDTAEEKLGMHGHDHGEGDAPAAPAAPPAPPETGAPPEGGSGETS